MEEITFLEITKYSSNLWGFTDSTMPENSDPTLANVYAGIAEGEYVSFTTRNGSNLYNRIPASIISYVDETNPANNFSGVSSLELIQYLKTYGFFGDGSGGEGGATTFLELLDVLFPNYAGRNGQLIAISGNGLTSIPIPSGLNQNNVSVTITRFFEGTGTVTQSDLSNYFNSQTEGITISETRTPVFIQITKDNKRYLFVYGGGKGTLGGPMGQVAPISFTLISVLNISPDDVENDPNAVINNLDPVTDGNYIDKANLSEWDFSDSGNIQEDGGVKTYYFTYTQDGVLYFVQFIGEQGEYGGTNPDFTEDMFASVTNSEETPDPLDTDKFQFRRVGWQGSTPNDPALSPQKGDIYGGYIYDEENNIMYRYPETRWNGTGNPLDIANHYFSHYQTIPLNDEI